MSKRSQKKCSALPLFMRQDLVPSLAVILALPFLSATEVTAGDLTHVPSDTAALPQLRMTLQRTARDDQLHASSDQNAATLIRAHSGNVSSTSSSARVVGATSESTAPSSPRSDITPVIRRVRAGRPWDDGTRDVYSDDYPDFEQEQASPAPRRRALPQEEWSRPQPSDTRAPYDWPGEEEWRQQRQSRQETGSVEDREDGSQQDQYSERDRRTYRTLCVRTCDGFYFPISFKTPISGFYSDARICSQQCPAAESELFYYPNPGGNQEDMISLSGVPYRKLANAYRYRKAMVPGCTCQVDPGTSGAGVLVPLNSSGDVDTTLSDIGGEDNAAKSNAAAETSPSQGKGLPTLPLLKSARERRTRQAENEREMREFQAAQKARADGPHTPIRKIGPTFFADQ